MSAATNGVDLEMFRKYAGLSLPRHVSYPMPTWWRDVGADEAVEMLRESRSAPSAPDLSVYVHIPFC